MLKIIALPYQRFRKLKTILTSLILIAIINPRAQGWASNTKSQTGSWGIVNVKSSINPKFNLFGEAQIRSQESLNDFVYWESKLIGHYVVNDQMSVGGGVGTYHQYNDYENFVGPQKQKEFRIWLEMVTKNNVGRLFFDHRLRVEQRFIQKWDIETSVFKNNFYLNRNDDDRYRFRYRMQLNLPINHKKMEANTIYVNISNEVQMTHEKPYFTQNRFFTGFGYKINNSQIQAGLMHQLLNGNTFERTKDYIQITYSFAIPGTLIK